MVEVRVPATSANMGAGFDTMGIALNMYNVIGVRETDKGLKITNKNSGEYIPVNESNLIYKAVTRVFDEVGYIKKGLEITQKSDIPMTRGLGSSSACIIGGLLAGNAISGNKLDRHKLLQLAVEIEGHPDNVVPAMYGGFCISVMQNGEADYQSFKISPKLKYAVMIPDYFAATKKSRESLPTKFSAEDAVFNISRAAWFSASLISGRFDALKIGVQDKMHQPYRESYVEGMTDIFKKSYELGAKATFLSGSGPTIIAVIDHDFDIFRRNMESFFKNSGHKRQCKIVEIDNVGAVVKTVRNRKDRLKWD